MDSLLSLIPFLEKQRKTPRSLPDFLEVENVLSFFCSLPQNKARFLTFSAENREKILCFFVLS